MKNFEKQFKKHKILTFLKKKKTKPFFFKKKTKNEHLEKNPLTKKAKKKFQKNHSINNEKKCWERKKAPLKKRFKETL